MISNWITEISLDELIEIKHGYAFKGEFFRDSPPGDILLTPGNFAIGGGFKGEKYKYYVGDVPADRSQSRDTDGKLGMVYALADNRWGNISPQKTTRT